MKLEQLILGLLSWGRFSGYELGKYLEQEGQFFRDSVHHTQIYRTLARMTTAGWVKFEVSANDGRQDTKTYSLTPAGDIELENWLEAPYIPSARIGNPEFKARFLLFGMRDRGRLVALLHQELDARRLQRRRDRSRERFPQYIEAAITTEPGVLHQMIDELHGQSAMASDHWINWLEDCLHRYAPEDSVPASDDAHHSTEHRIEAN